MYFSVQVGPSFKLFQISTNIKFFELSAVPHNARPVKVKAIVSLLSSLFTAKSLARTQSRGMKQS